MNEQSPNSNRVFDLTERTARFGEAVLVLARRVGVSPVTRSVIDQLARSATSVGANYCEADDSDSRKDFKYRIGLCRREAKETKHWLRMLATAAPEFREDARTLWQEAQELTLIFSAIRKKLEAKQHRTSADLP